MTTEPGNNHMFFAYHIRSASLMFESALQEILDDQDISLEEFYVLRCDWKSEETSIDDIRAHSGLTADEAVQAITELVTKGYILKAPKDGFYVLPSKGVSMRQQLLARYRAFISKAIQGLPDKKIEAALVSLLRVQNNIQQT